MTHPYLPFHSPALLITTLSTFFFSSFSYIPKTMPKLLAEFLREQQEPFSLDLYLLERGVSRGNEDAPHLDHDQNHHHFSKGSSVCSPRKTHRAATNCSRFVKAVFGKLALNLDTGKGEKRFSCTKVFNSCSESELDDSQCHNLKNEEVNKQLSPVSVLEETKSEEEGSPLCHKHSYFKASQCESSTSQKKSSKQQHHHCSSSTTGKEVQEQGNELDLNLQYLTNKRLLQQTKRLLIDCVREVIENHRRRDKNKEQLKQILDADELWKLVCENVWIWSKDSRSVVHLLHSDFLDSLEEWNCDYEHKKEEITVGIGDDILEDIIKEITVGLG